MTSIKDFVDLRKQQRFKLKEGVFVEFYKPRLFNLGNLRLVNYAPVTDISEGGLGFVYTDRQMWLHDLNELTISDKINEIKIDNISFKILRDFKISKLPNSKYLRKCGVSFGVLTSEQKASLYSLVHSHTVINDTMDRRSGKDRRQGSDLQNKDFNKRNGIERRSEKGRRKYDNLS